MPKKGCKTTSVNIENNLYLMAIGEGIDMTGFVNRCLALFFDVPEDPREKLIRDKSQYAVLRLKEKYNREVSEIIKEHAAQQAVIGAAKEKENELIQFGEYLKRSTAFPVLLSELKRHDMNDDTLSIITSDINRMDGHQYDAVEVWNKAINWYQKYGEATT